MSINWRPLCNEPDRTYFVYIACIILFRLDTITGVMDFEYLIASAQKAAKLIDC
jgi:hypothetical protein